MTGKPEFISARGFRGGIHRLVTSDEQLGSNPPGPRTPVAPLCRCPSGIDLSQWVGDFSSK